MEPESRKVRKKAVKRRRTKQPFLTKKFKFAEDSHFYYWEAAIVLSLILIFFVIFIGLYVVAWINYVPSD